MATVADALAGVRNYDGRVPTGEVYLLEADALDFIERCDQLGIAITNVDCFVREPDGHRIVGQLSWDAEVIRGDQRWPEYVGQANEGSRLAVAKGKRECQVFALCPLDQGEMQALRDKGILPSA